MMVASRDTDVRVALALGWRWQRLPSGLELLVPPENSYFYGPDDGGLQLVPAYSSDPHVWEAYVTEIREHWHVSVHVTGKGAWVFVDDQSFTAPTVPLALCRMVLEHEARRAA